MSDASTSNKHKISPFRERRIKRLKKEIALLEGMTDALWRESLRWSFSFIFTLLLIFLICASTLNGLGLSRTILLSVSALAVFGFWWLTRYSTILVVTLASLGLVVLVGISIIALLESSPIDWPNGLSNPNRPSKNELRRLKVKAAIDKRKALLTKLEAA